MTGAAATAPIVSLTTISTRIDRVEQVLESILAQRLRPSRVYLWLSKEPHLIDRGIDEAQLSPRVRAWRESGEVRVGWTRNTGPYRKLVPTLREHWSEKQQAIVTADDDTIYPRDWLSDLDARARQEPDAVVAYRVREMCFWRGRLRPYGTWAPLSRFAPLRSRMFFPTGKDGVLFRPAFFPEQVFDEEAFLALAPTNDDIWFRAMTLLAGVDVARVTRVHDDFPQTAWSGTGSLFEAANSSKNDPMIRATFERVGLDARRILGGVPWTSRLSGHLILVERALRRLQSVQRRA